MHWIRELEEMKTPIAQREYLRIPLYYWDNRSDIKKKEKNDLNRAKDGTNIVIIDMNGE
tara:strand:+ start:376 stop:552 length:177 start_codon:yes stop_codon:yes gene_type:complete